MLIPPELIPIEEESEIRGKQQERRGQLQHIL